VHLPTKGVVHICSAGGLMRTYTIKQKIAQEDFIVKHYNKDMTALEIAVALNIPKGTVITRYHQKVGNRIKNKYFPTGEGKKAGVFRLNRILKYRRKCL
jgi:hypothetical protein